MQKYKYQNEIEGSEICDLSKFIEQERIAFRWTFEDIKDSRNFIPRPFLNPKTNTNNCTVWGISLFDTKENGVNRMNKLKAKSRNIYKKLGTHIAKGDIVNENGVSDLVNAEGHFTLIEYIDVDLSQKFNVLGEL
ncbi:MAG: hypothetical protein V3V28_05750 [Polaribacter sp.]|uniref:hypothetical protein n=1 Tax=Polaribacter sp. TaxID=1920175 RepID=UPI002F35F1BA